MIIITDIQLDNHCNQTTAWNIDLHLMNAIENCHLNHVLGIGISVIVKDFWSMTVFI